MTVLVQPAVPTNTVKAMILIQASCMSFLSVCLPRGPSGLFSFQLVTQNQPAMPRNSAPFHDQNATTFVAKWHDYDSPKGLAHP